MRIKIFMIICLLHKTNAQLARDWSFQEMCNFWGGEKTYHARKDGFKSLEGDKCTFNFPKASNNQESAQQYCEDNVPYHINNAEASEYKTTCEAEATLICKSGWVQMFGRCYKITKTMMTRDKAEEHCKNQQDHTSTIAFMHREALPFRWNDYFTRVSRIWMDASKVITNDLIYDIEDGNVLLAFDGYKYNLPNVAIARVPKDETAMVLCEYTPPMTKSESNYLLRRYGEIYYPPLVTSESVYMSTTSSRIRDETDQFADNKYCTNVMRPIFRGLAARSAFPTKEFVDKLEKEAAIIRSATVSQSANQKGREESECVVNQKPIHQVFASGQGGKTLNVKIDQALWRKGEPKETCDAASWSSAIVLSRDGEKGLETMSDARYAPIYCEAILDKYEYGPCPAGFLQYDRTELGIRWCHKLYSELETTYDDAEKECLSLGAHVSGFSDLKEKDFMHDMIMASPIKNKTFNRVWIGAQRRPECNTLGVEGKTGGFDTDDSKPCARSRVFYWLHGVALNPPDFIEHWADPNEPNFLGDKEKCVVVMTGSEWTHWKFGINKKINDVSCGRRYPFFCGKEAPIVKVTK
ncbi:C-type lectin domain-containing protein [Caenorhabditis elegans]|uniref:C-type lectin domain-containing protein n=1 Tax=Caenorhabditis elegans TaxID=6239 RepID=Q19315_CAEEL|nr:C-type lectin domain-containing protein [Caenorhabditis elegans]CAA84654.1 C-type lectin domain-containing protein [Caenorhabditis elegans]|eukprot:NP_497946.1 C-type LECtin [Caenorhabditis elegans]